MIIYYYVPGIFRGFEKKSRILTFLSGLYLGHGLKTASTHSLRFTEPQTPQNFMAIMTSSKLF